MKKSGSSRTAELAAMTRAIALHSNYASVVMNDPYAKLFIGPFVIVPYFFNRILMKINPYFWKRGINSIGFLIALCRHRYLSDLLLESIGQGFRQVILLGAGYDTNFIRNHEQLRDVKLFEIDHPNTQSRKVRIVMKKSLESTNKVNYIGLDLVCDSIGNQLDSIGLNSKEKLLVIAEGVLSYLPTDAFDRVLKSVSTLSDKVRFAADYRYPQLTNQNASFTIKRWRNEFRFMNEKYKSFFNKAGMEEKLAGFGFYSVKHFNLADLWKEYSGENPPYHLRNVAGLFVSENENIRKGSH
jgi:methyltransferase (TIGR00027 family)